MGNRISKVIIVLDWELWIVHSFQENRQTKERTYWYGRFKRVFIRQSVYQREWIKWYDITGNG